MDVAVTHKRGQWLRSIAAPSILGDGMLERARATSLGLLGFTTAVGLTIVALAFNQAWPLVEGGPVPPLPVRHQSVGEAKAASGARGGDRVTALDRSWGKRTAEAPASGGGSAPSESSPSPATNSPAASGPVVAPSAPAPSEGGDVPRGDSKSESAPAKPAPVSPPAAAPSPPAEPAPSPPMPTPAPEPEPPASVSEAPPTSSVPPWSNGNGHAYGRSGEPPGHGHDE